MTVSNYQWQSTISMESGSKKIQTDRHRVGSLQQLSRALSTRSQNFPGNWNPYSWIPWLDSFFPFRNNFGNEWHRLKANPEVEIKFSTLWQAFFIMKIWLHLLKDETSEQLNYRVLWEIVQGMFRAPTVWVVVFMVCAFFTSKWRTLLHFEMKNAHTINTTTNTVGARNILWTISQRTL